MTHDQNDDGEWPGDDELWFDAAIGADPQAPDPGCLHEWNHLQFDETGDDLVCGRCTRTWSVDDDPREALLTVWQSARIGLSRLERGVERIAAVLSVIGDVYRCSWCDRWSADDQDFLQIGERRCCREHLGQLLADRSPAREEELDDAVTWLLGNIPSENGTVDLRSLWLLEKAIVEHPGLEEEIPGQIGGRLIELGPGARRVLRCDGPLGVATAVRALSEILDLPAPVSRAGRAVIIGVLAQCDVLVERGGTVDESGLCDLFTEVAPFHNRDRATVVLDLYRHDLPEDGTLSGDMADDLVEALLSRVATELAPILTGDDGHPSAR